MTLCIVYKYRNQHFLISDIIISSNDDRLEDVIPEDILKAPKIRQRTITRLDRKIVKINPTLALQWSGNYDRARFAIKMLDQFDFNSEASIDSFIKQYCQGFTAVISGVIDGKFVFRSTGLVRGFHHDDGFIACIGSGADEFLERFKSIFPTKFPTQYSEIISVCLEMVHYDVSGIFDGGYGFWFEVYYLNQDHGFLPLQISSRDLVNDNGEYYLGDRRTLSYYSGDDLCLIYGINPRIGAKFFFLPCLRGPKNKLPPPLRWEIKPDFTLTHIINLGLKLREGTQSSDFGRPEEKFIVTRTGKLIDSKIANLHKILDRCGVPKEKRRVWKKKRRL
ncbi:MAG: hypothetical protein AAFS07_13330 [Pseudomonadota bacterium]